MLTHLSIRNFAIIDHWDLDLQPHLSIITGESGAGKSIFIDAIELALGARADSTCIAQGADRAEIVLTFDISHLPKVTAWLEDNDYEHDDQCIIRRIITKEGRSRSSINGSPCTLQQIKSLAEHLMHIHGQHQNQSLLQKSYQLEVLDHFANHPELLSAVRAQQQQWQDTKTRLQYLQNHSDNFGAQLELLQYQVQELDELDLSETEYDELDVEQKHLANAESYLHSAQQGLHQLNNDDNTGAINQLHHILAALPTDTAQTQSAIECLNQAIIQLDEAESELHQFIDSFQADPERLAEVESRLERIHTLARKHHVEPSRLYDHHQDLQQQLNDYLTASTDAAKLEQQLSTLYNEYRNACAALTQSRQHAALSLAEQVSQKIQLLGMKGGQFAIHLEPHPDETPRATGSDSVIFQVSANPGQPLQALSKVASGGETSRVALAIQVISTQTMVTPTLIFDEVDVGIGGNTAAVVGNLLRELGRVTQVLCITHQPQVAACGHQHLHVQKSTQDDRTHTTIAPLNADQRVEELARMLGGMTITENTKANAKELLATI